MKNVKVKLIITVLSLLTIVIAISIGISVLKNNNISEGNDNSIISDEGSIKDLYKFGDAIIIAKLAVITDYYNMGDENDFSCWHILEDDGEYLTLMSDISIFTTNLASTPALLLKTKEVFEKNGLVFGPKGDLRLINENDLQKYFGCSLSDLTCDPASLWLGDMAIENQTLTAVYSNEKIGVFNFDHSLKFTAELTANYPVFPVMKVLKASI